LLASLTFEGPGSDPVMEENDKTCRRLKLKKNSKLVSASGTTVRNDESADESDTAATDQSGWIGGFFVFSPCPQRSLRGGAQQIRRPYSGHSSSNELPNEAIGQLVLVTCARHVIKPCRGNGLNGVGAQEMKEKKEKEDLRASANPPERGIATERRRKKIQIPPAVGFNLLNGAKGEMDDPIRQIERGAKACGWQNHWWPHALNAARIEKVTRSFKVQRAASNQQK
jgi:hypothetical protein